MAERPVVILGAGASRDAGAPGLGSLLREAFDAEAQALPTLLAFLQAHFRFESLFARFPPLPLVLGILDTALDRKQDMGPDWGMARLRQVRREVEYGIFATLKDLEPTRDYLDLIEWLTTDDIGPTIISLNYDLLADAALVMHAQKRYGEIRFPDYGCEISTESYRQRPRFGKLYKLIGSLHWMYCPACQWLDALFYSEGAMPSGAGRAFDSALLGDAYAGQPRLCPRANCGDTMRPVMVTPSPVQERSNTHIARIRYFAERALQSADAAIFIGYGLHMSDLELLYLLQRGLAYLPPQRITVVASRFEDVRERYLDLLGREIHWTNLDFSTWMTQKGPLAAL